jgi:isoquinoline 1-oxidoreductase beta subunit
MYSQQPVDRGSEPAPLLTRRRLLQAAGAAGLVISFALPHTGRAEVAAASSFHPNAWLRINTDGQITVICGSAEMGQGVLTAIPMLMAEELDADWRTVRVEQAPADKAYANPLFGIQATGGSSTVRAHWEPVRKAGAAAREMLVAAAAARWQVEASQCRTERGDVLHPDGKTRLGYGALTAAAAGYSVPANPKLKEPKEFRLLGQALPRLDTPAKVTGSARYGLDMQLPGLVVAVMARAPMLGAKPVKIDDSKARAVKGVLQVQTIPNGVAVLASGYWAAKKGRDALQIEWDLGSNADLDDAKVTAMLTQGASSALAAAGELPKSATELEVQYEAPYLAHACMEPLNCTAWVRGDDVEIWAGTQSQGPAQGILAQVAQTTPAKVKVNTLLLGGGFGRRFAPDFTIDATLLSKRSGLPVKLIYSREDDMRAGYYRPAATVRFKAGIDANGQPLGLMTGVAAPSIMAASGFMQLPANGVDRMAVEGLQDQPYDLGQFSLSYARCEPGPQVWFWRSVGHSQNIFFMESMIDEMAAAARIDPFEYRRALLGRQPRYKAVLELAAQQADWGQPLPAGVFRGIAVAQSFGSYVAQVAEVSVSVDGTPRVHRVVAAVDCGMTVNPGIIRQQIEGAIVYGLSAALHGRISLKAGRVQEGNFNDYPVLRMHEMPRVEVHILPSSENPGGIGEPGTPPIAPAVTNAIFAATGQRIRRLPIDPAQLRRT